MLATLKETYWEGIKVADMWRHALVRGGDDAVRSVVVNDHLVRRRARVKPMHGEARARADAAAAWLIEAHEATPDGGVSYGYFPVSGAMGWEPSYPETTGYIITSLLAYERLTGRADLLERAVRMARWEAEIQMDSGAVQGGKLTTPDKRRAAAFNTGMVLDGFTSVLGRVADAEIESAARRAADFLVADMTDAGLFTTNGPYVSADKIKLFNVLCAWALFRFGALIDEGRYRQAAVDAVEGALRFMTPNGWLRENCLSDAARPLTHTIGYSLQGILEVGVLAERRDFVAAARKGLDPILGHIKPNGFLAGRFDAEWRPVVGWSCLTGSAQLAIVSYRLAEILGDDTYGVAGDRLVDFLKAVQRVDTGNPGIDGALAGSFPIFGDYMTGGYPNWATKYLLDALLHQVRRTG